MHAFIFVDFAENPIYCLRYDGGSKFRIETDQPYVEYGHDFDYFLYAYRAPEILKKLKANNSSTANKQFTRWGKRDSSDPIEISITKEDVQSIRLPYSEEVLIIGTGRCECSDNYIYNYGATKADVSLEGYCRYWLADVVANDTDKKIVCYDGTVANDGCRIIYDKNSLRPIIILNRNDYLSEINIGDDVKCLDNIWVKVSENKLLLKYAVGNFKYCETFDKGNAYANSDIKISLENWFANL